MGLSVLVPSAIHESVLVSTMSKPSYHLHSNGAVDRLVRTMKRMLAAKIADATHDGVALPPQLCMD